MGFESPWPHISPVESPRGISGAANSSGDRSMVVPVVKTKIVAQ
jgi:hypothetical protein